MNYKQCAKLLLTHENILIVTHRNPDGDTVASAAALCSALRRGGRNAYLYPNPQVNRHLRPFAEKYFAPEDFTAKYTVAVDVATEGMLPKGFEGAVDLCIDHHPTNSGYAGETLVRADKSNAVIHERERSRRGEKLRPGDGAQRLRGRFGAAKL